MTQTQAKEHSASTTGEGPALSVKDLWKIFGDKADKVIGTPDADLSRKDLRQIYLL